MGFAFLTGRRSLSDELATCTGGGFILCNAVNGRSVHPEFTLPNSRQHSSHLESAHHLLRCKLKIFVFS